MTDTVPLLDHMLALMTEADVRYQQRFEAQTTAINAALLAAEKAVTKAEIAADKRFELLNELRVGVATKEQVDALEKRINEQAARLDRTEGRSGGLNAGWGYLVGGFGVLLALVAIYTNLNA